MHPPANPPAALPRRVTAQRWGITLGATVVSTVAVDALLSAAGVALAATQLLQGLGTAMLLVVLAASYAAWFAGLWANLAANWALLQATGTSTNALSKAAHDVTARRWASARAQRVAASAGYVATDVAKEVPYYAGAFGAALTATVDAADALVFLAGANLGAAVYEYGLARLTRTFLRLRQA